MVLLLLLSVCLQQQQQPAKLTAAPEGNREKSPLFNGRDFAAAAAAAAAMAALPPSPCRLLCKEGRREKRECFGIA